MAASSIAVTVLAPNGRRQAVKVSPSTPIQQILEEVCKKQNFSPDEYDLKFQRTVLNLSLQWRFANLPNNAKLEMVPSTRQRAGVESTIAGEEALKKMTLKSLGLTGGSAIVRYIVKKSKVLEQTETMQMGAAVEAKPKEEVELSAGVEAAPCKKDVEIPVEKPASSAISTVVQNNTAEAVSHKKESDLNLDIKEEAPIDREALVYHMDAEHRQRGEVFAEDLPDEFFQPIDREALVYHMDAEHRQRGEVFAEDLPDEFFQVTVDDIRKRFAQLKSEREVLEEAPLLTKSLRESRMKEKIQRYPKSDRQET
ncbi:UNVERIFIED_CONTAM: hypothetical protein FKN15_024175 [Acipenser sinensis]